MKFKKIIVTTLAVIMALGCVGCKAGKASGDGNATQYADRDIHLTVNYFDGGYGREWIYKVVEDYMENVNKDVYVEVVLSYDTVTSQNELQSGVAADDIYLMEGGTFDYGAYLAEVDDVWNSKAYGEDTLIKDKVNDGIYEFYNEDGKYYQLPYAKEIGYNLTYNLSTLNEVLGEGNYVLPRTTDEYFALGDALAAKNTNLLVGAMADTQGGDYTGRLFEVWFAQMTGFEGYNNYFNGLYKNASGELVLGEDPVAYFGSYKDAIESAYAALYKLASKENHYIYSDSPSLNYKGADQVFFGGGYGIKKTKVASIYTGPWVESEVADLLEDGIIQEQEIVAGKLPVMSAITKRCATISDDATLAKVVDYVDGVISERPAGVSDNDIAIVKEARNMVGDARCKAIVIPKCSDRIEEAKDLIKYFASDRAQKISATYAHGINQLPYGYVPTEEDLGVELTSNVKTILEKAKDAIIVDVSHLNQKFFLATNVKWCSGTTKETGYIAIFAGNGTDPADVFNSTLAKFNTKQWPLYIENYYDSLNK